MTAQTPPGGPIGPQHDGDDHLAAQDDSATVLAALDYPTPVVVCQCPQHECANVATHRVTVHHIDRCTHPSVDSHGNISDILCNRCILAAVQDTAAWLRAVARVGRSYCLTCAMPLTHVADVIRGLEPL